MYRKLQEEVRKYIVGEMCKFSGDWKFDIEDGEKGDIIVYNPDGEIIRCPIELMHKNIPKELFENMKGWDDQYAKKRLVQLGGCFLIRRWLGNVFDIYGIQIACDDAKEPIMYTITSRDGIKTIQSYTWIDSTCCLDKVIVPYRNNNLAKRIAREEIIPSLLLLLDPVEYFRRHSLLILKSEKVNEGNTFETYELMLGYFPEMDKELVEKYWGIRSVFCDSCIDVAVVIGKILIDLRG